MKGKRKGLMMGLFLLVMGLMVACGKEGDPQGANSGGNTATTVAGEITVKEKDSELVYLAESLDLELESETSYGMDFGLSGEGIYYVSGQEVLTYSVADESTTRKPLKWADAPVEWFLNQAVYGADNSIYATVAVRGVPNLVHYLCKFDGEGQLIHARELTEYFKEAGESWSSSCRLELGEDGRLYLSGRSFVWIFEEDGSYKGKVNLGNVQSATIRDMKKAVDGKLYVLYENNANQSTYVAEINTAAGELSNQQKFSGLTGLNGLFMESGKGLAFSDSSVYSYDRAALTMEKLFDWTDCNIDGTYSYNMAQLEDGRIFAAVNQPSGECQCFLIQGLTKEEAALVQPEKVEIKLALLNEPSSNLKTAVVFFNRESDKYTVTVEDYRTEASEAGDDAGRNRLNSEIAAGKSPDIVHMSFYNLQSLVEKGFYENLYDYLEKSTVLSKEDFLEVALKQYEVDGVLAAIPHDISLQLNLGRKSIVGEGPGWTLEEMLDIVEANGENAIFAEDTTKRAVLIQMLRMNESYFVNRETGECNFDNDLFKRILQFAAKFPDKTTGWYEGKTSNYVNIESGNGFLVNIGVASFRKLQVYAAAYNGDMTCIGYPVGEGIGCIANCYDGLGISSQSQCKEGAWAFIEYYLQYANLDRADDSNVRFPSYKPTLAKVADRSMTDSRSSAMHSSDGWSYAYHVSTQEEIDQVYELLESAQIVDINTDIIDIIAEEAGSYFAGDKSIDAVVRIIENRVELYLQENQ